jgi:uncharacterized protein (TIGR04222 family)
MAIESTAIFYSDLVLGSIALSFCIAKMLRWVSIKSNASLKPIEKAYLIGGPTRAVEMALFLAVREGWARHDGSGFFLSRVSEAPSELSHVERELLRALSESEGLTALQIRGLVKELAKSSLQETDGALISKGMILSHGEFRLANLLSLFPILGAIGIGAVRALQDSIQAQGIETPLIATVILLLMMARMKNRFHRRTRLGERTVAQLRSAALARPRPRKNPSFEDTYINPFDRLRDIEDDILFHGLSSLIGTAFAPIATFMSDSEKKSGGFQWGTVEQAPGIPNSENFKRQRVSGDSD